MRCGRWLSLQEWLKFDCVRSKIRHTDPTWCLYFSPTPCGTCVCVCVFCVALSLLDPSNQTTDGQWDEHNGRGRRGVGLCVYVCWYVCWGVGSGSVCDWISLFLMLFIVLLLLAVIVICYMTNISIHPSIHLSDQERSFLGLLPVGHNQNTSQGWRPKQRTESPQLTPLWVGGAAALLRAPLEWPSSSP